MNRLNYHHLYLFWILAKEGTFTKSAERLSIAQSAVTSQIKQLEETLDMKLMDRTNRRKPVLTEEGKLVLEFADSIFEKGEELLKWSKLGIKSVGQVVRIGAISGLSRNFQYEFIAPLVERGDVKIEVVTGDQEKLVRLLKEHSLDMILSSHSVPSEGRVSFHSHVLNKSPVVFVVKNSLKIRSGDLKEHLRKLPLCLPSKSFEARPELDAFLGRLKLVPNVIAEVDDIALLRILAIRSGSVVAIPEMGVINELKTRDLVIVGKATGIEQRFYAVTRQRQFPSALAEKLIETIRKKP
jgi:LysR family transcriptional activator of nhaA